MLKVMVMTDNPSLPTGMAKVGREIAMALHNAGHEVVYLGWFMSPPNPKRFPFKIVTCENRTFGSDILDQAWANEQFDVLITIGDLWRLDYIADPRRCKTRKFFQWIAYTAIDGEAMSGGIPKYLHPNLVNPDKVIVYTEWARQAVLKKCPWMEKDLSVIYHGVDPSIYYPLPPSEKKAVRKEFNTEGKFVFLMVCRNFGRKNIPDVFKAWLLVCEDEEMAQEGRRATFWPHMNFSNEPGGLNLHQVIETYGFNDKKRRNIQYIQQVAEAKTGVHLPDEKTLNKIYNAADCLVSAGSEGFGLPVLEAMATKLPVIALDHSATSELCAEGRGIKFPVRHNITGQFMHERPYPDYKEVKDAMKEMYSDEEKRLSCIEEGYKFSQQHSWKKKAEQWVQVLERLEFPLKNELTLEEVS